MADKTCSLLEFIAFCFEKNEIWSGGCHRDCPYSTPELAREQYERLVREASQYFHPEVPREIARGLHWPGQLTVLHTGCMVVVRVAARRDGPAYTWGDWDPDWTHANASDDSSILFDAADQVEK